MLKPIQVKKINDFSKVGVKQLGPYRIRFLLEQSMPDFQHFLAVQSLTPVRMDLIEKFGEKWVEPENLAVLGPYTIVNWNDHGRVIYHANRNFSGSTPRVKKIHGYLHGGTKSSTRLFRVGKIDIKMAV